MSLRPILAVVAVFLTWSMLDLVIHGMLLDPIYQATADLWRPVEEMKMALMYAVAIATAACFVMIYTCLVTRKSLAAGLKLGALFGLASGVSMGWGFYGYMPIPLSLAWGWFLSILINFVLAGALVGAIVKSREEAS
ncbi:MAG: hypothetical protein F4Y47_04660 [Acidobacteriia bacterium]|nr:hypothetical protein [Terriglobia bacterium]MYG03745.1 hypothetical protein [Terriglobia bacterium]MYK11985.1 hypothetical protein [Terriglobia bacterium]